MDKIKNPSFFNRILRSKLLIGAEIIILILISVALVKELVRRQQIEKEVSTLKKEIASLEKNRLELTDLAQYFNSQAYKEEQAREKLGLAKPGETALIMPDTKNEALEPQGDVTTTTTATSKLSSNPQKWWDYFFKTN